MINEELGNVGQTVVYTDPVVASPVDHIEALSTLVGDINAGRVDLLVVVDTNPVYTAPADFRFAEAMGRVADFSLVAG